MIVCRCSSPFANVTNMQIGSKYCAQCSHLQQRFIHAAGSLFGIINSVFSKLLTTLKKRDAFKTINLALSVWGFWFLKLGGGRNPWGGPGIPSREALKQTFVRHLCNRFCQLHSRDPAAREEPTPASRNSTQMANYCDRCSAFLLFLLQDSAKMSQRDREEVF